MRYFVFFFLSLFFYYLITDDLINADGLKGGLNIENSSAQPGTVTQTIKITKDMKNWIETHFDSKVKGEYLSISEIKVRNSGFFLKILSKDKKILRKRAIGSAIEIKKILKEIKDGDHLINYIDKISTKQENGINKSNVSVGNQNIKSSKITKQLTKTQTKGQPVSLVGKWMGAIIVYPKVIYLKMDLSQSNSGAYEGDVYFVPSNLYKHGMVLENNVHVESAKAKLTYTNSTEGFTLNFNRTRSFSTQYSMKFRNAGGVVDTVGQRLAGAMRSSPSSLDDYFFFVRPQEFDKVVEIYYKFGRGLGGGGSLRNLFSGLSDSVPSDSVLKEWFELFKQNYPDMDLYHVAHGKLEFMALDLFNDQYFRKHFDGKTFDELSNGTLDKVNKKLDREFLRSNNRDERSLGTLSRMFWRVMGSPSGLQTLQGVLSLRGYDAWYKQQLSRIEQMSGSQTDWATLRHLESVFDSKGAETSLFMPNRFSTANEKLAAARGRIAFPYLETQLVQFEQQLDSPSQRLLLEINSWHNNEHKKLSYISRSEKEALLAKINSMRIVAVERLVPSYMEQINTLGEGFDAVLAGNQWYESFSKGFKGAEDVPAFKSTMDRFVSKRKDVLATARQAMLSKISVLSSDELNKPFQNWLILPSDKNNSLYGDISGAVKNRRQEIFRLSKQKEHDRRMSFDSENAATQTNHMLQTGADSGANYLSYHQLAGLLFQYAGMVRGGSKYKVSDAEAYFNKLRLMGYQSTDKKPGKLSDFMYFKNSQDYEIFAHVQGDPGSQKIVLTSLKIPNPSTDIIKHYQQQLLANHRHILRPSKDRNYSLPSDEFYANEDGSYLAKSSIDADGSLEIEVWDNANGGIDIIAERLKPGLLRVTPRTTLTDIRLESGDIVTFKAAGSMSLGGMLTLLSGRSGPDGSRYKELQAFNVVSGFPHGALIGRIGKGEWFLIGTGSRLTVNRSGLLSLAVNDNKVIDNSGYFDVNYLIE